MGRNRTIVGILGGDAPLSHRRQAEGGGHETRRQPMIQQTP